jgi:hypothetical protein
MPFQALRFSPFSVPPLHNQELSCHTASSATPFRITLAVKAGEISTSHMALCQAGYMLIVKCQVLLAPLDSRIRQMFK